MGRDDAVVRTDPHGPSQEPEKASGPEHRGLPRFQTVTARLVLSHLGVALGVGLLLGAGFLFVNWRAGGSSQRVIAQTMARQLALRLAPAWDRPQRASDIVAQVRRLDHVGAATEIVFGVWRSRGTTLTSTAPRERSLVTYRMLLTVDPTRARTVVNGETQDDAIAWAAVARRGSPAGIIGVDLGPVPTRLGVRSWLVISLLGATGIALGLFAGWSLSRKLVTPLRALPAVTYAGATGGDMEEAPRTAPLEIQMVWRTSTQAVADARAATRSDLLHQQHHHQLFRQMSHDLRAPTSLMSAMVAELHQIPIADPELQAQRDERLTKIEVQLQHLQTRIADVVAAANASIEDPQKVVDAARLVRKRLDELEAYFAFRGVRPHGDFDADVLIRARPVALGLTVGELMMNALHHGAGAPVHVAVVKDLPSLRATICVEDAGPGIPEPERERVLQAGERGSGAAQGGFGFGLAMAYSVVRQMGGTLELGRSAQLGGLAVTVEFPLATERPWLGRGVGATEHGRGQRSRAAHAPVTPGLR